MPFIKIARRPTAGTKFSMADDNKTVRSGTLIASLAVAHLSEKKRVCTYIEDNHGRLFSAASNGWLVLSYSQTSSAEE